MGVGGEDADVSGAGGGEKGEEGRKRGSGAQREGGGKEDRHTGRGREEAIRATRARGDEENTRTR